MSKQLYISPIIGTGTKSDPYRAKLADFKTAYVTVIPTDASGKPRFNWAVCLVGGNAHATIQADPSNVAWPDISLDAQIGTIGAAARNSWQTILTNHGVNLTGITLQSTMRDVLRRVAQTLEPAFNGASFDCVDA